MPDRELWTVLNKDLATVCSTMLVELPSVGPSGDRRVDILAGFFRKATQVLHATNVLAETGYWDEVQTLARELFELRLKAEYFLRIAQEDPDNACQMLVDAWFLQRAKEWETSNWVGASPEVKCFYSEQMDVLRKRLDTAEIKKLRRYGFPGLSVEACARALGHDTAYQVIYRRFGRAIHSSDFAEFMAGPNPSEDLEYREWRDPFVAYVVHFSAGGIAEAVNARLLKGSHDEALDEIGQRSRKLRPSDGRPIVPAD